MSDVRKGYVCIHRELLDHWLWDIKPMTKGQAWIDLILLANYKDKQFSYKDQVMDGKRGSVHRSISSLAERWGWGRNKATRFLDELEADGMIVRKKSNHHTIITIVNYGKYQDAQAMNRQLTGEQSESNRQRIDDQRATNRQPVGTYKKEKKGKNDKKENHFLDVSDGGQSPEEIEEADQWFDSL